MDYESWQGEGEGQGYDEQVDDFDTLNQDEYHEYQDDYTDYAYKPKGTRFGKISVWFRSVKHAIRMRFDRTYRLDNIPF